MKLGHHETLLEMRDLEVRYGDFGAVRGVDLAIERGRLTALVGPSGCGKTSLLRAIAGFEPPARGEIRLAGEVLAGPEHWVPPEKRPVGMVFQEGALFPHLTVAGNVRYGVDGLADADARVGEVLRLVGLHELAHRMPDELSGGQQQRLALARALAPAPAVVLLDEPFASLDAGLREQVREQVREILSRAGTTAVLVTHDQEEALSFADRVAVMVEGRVLQVGSPEEVYHRPACLEVAQFIGVGRLLPGEARGGRMETVFGPLDCELPDGPALALLRPEDLAILPGSPGEGLPGTVEDRRFYGHDVLDRVRLASGELYDVRVLSSTAVPLGSPVRLLLRRHDLPVYAAPAAPGG